MTAFASQKRTKTAQKSFDERDGVYEHCPQQKGASPYSIERVSSMTALKLLATLHKLVEPARYGAFRQELST
jgi:hypothetical protein